MRSHRIMSRQVQLELQPELGPELELELGFELGPATVITMHIVPRKHFSKIL